MTKYSKIDIVPDRANGVIMVPHGWIDDTQTLPKWIFSCRDLSMVEKIMLGVIHQYTKSRGSYINSADGFANELGVDKKTIDRGIEKMERLGYIKYGLVMPKGSTNPLKKIRKMWSLRVMAYGKQDLDKMSLPEPGQNVPAAESAKFTEGQNVPADSFMSVPNQPILRENNLETSKSAEFSERDILPLNEPINQPNLREDEGQNVPQYFSTSHTQKNRNETVTERRDSASEGTGPKEVTQRQEPVISESEAMFNEVWKLYDKGSESVGRQSWNRQELEEKIEILKAVKSLQTSKQYRSAFDKYIDEGKYKTKPKKAKEEPSKRSPVQALSVDLEIKARADQMRARIKEMSQEFMEEVMGRWGGIKIYHRETYRRDPNPGEANAILSELLLVPDDQLIQAMEDKMREIDSKRKRIVGD